MKRNPDHPPVPPREIPILALRVPEAAKAIGISPSLMYQLIREGRIHAAHPSEGRTVIAVEELKRFLAQGAPGGDPRGGTLA
jgi:excisionase family DNA binding protein